MARRDIAQLVDLYSCNWVVVIMGGRVRSRIAQDDTVLNLKNVSLSTCTSFSPSII